MSLSSMARAVWTFLLVLSLGGGVLAQDGGQAGNQQPAEGGKPEGQPEGKPDPAPEAKPAETEPPVFVMEPKLHKDLAKRLGEYFRPGKRTRAEMLDKLQAFIDKKSPAGNSLLEDVATWTQLANESRLFERRVGKKGTVARVKVPPQVHGFPTGLGTVYYRLYLPKSYKPNTLWPMIFCLPDNKVWPDGVKYIKEMWLRNPATAADWIVMVPEPQSKGEDWTKERSWARAMIALRHATGTFDTPPKHGGGPAVDLRRIFADGNDAAALAAARFPELFVGVVLHGADGRATRAPNLRMYGGLSGLPAYCVLRKPKKRSNELAFANKVLSLNDKSAVEQVPEGGDAKLLGTVGKIDAWMAGINADGHSDQPTTVDYVVHDGSFQRAWWITVLEHDPSHKPRPMLLAVADRKTNTVTITPEGLLHFEIFLNDALVDLNNEITILIDDGGDEPIEFYKGTAERSLSVALNELVASNHPWRMYPVRFEVDMPSLRAQEAKRLEAAKAAAGAQGGGAAPAEKPGADDKGKEDGKGKGLSAPPSKDPSK